MKKLYTLLSLLILSISAWSQVLLHEPFNYGASTTAGLNIQSGGLWTTTASGDSIFVENGNLTYPGLSASTGNHVSFGGSGTDYLRDLTGQTSGTVYSSFIIQIDSSMGLDNTGGYFYSLVQTGSTSAFGSSVWFRKSAVAGKLNIGISNRSNTAVTWLPTEMDSFQTYFVVLSYQFVTGTGNDTSRIWLNTSALGSTEPLADGVAFGGTDLTSVGRVILRQDSNNETPWVSVDEIRVGSNWSDVTPSGVVASASVTAGTLADFGIVTQGLTSPSQALSISGTNLTGAPGVLTVTAPSQFQVSLNNTGFSSSVNVPYSSATLSSTTVYVRFAPQSPGQVNENISISGGGLSSPVLVAVSGTGAALQAPVATSATSVGTTGFTANWNAVSGANNYFLDVYTISGGSSVATIAGWNFAINTSASKTADVGNSINVGIDTISLNGSTGALSYPSGPSGSSGTPNPYSISANGWDNGIMSKYWQVDVNTTGATNITLSSLQGGSNTGPKEFKVQYKVGSSGTWTDVSGGTVILTTAVSAGNLATWGALNDLPLPSDASNKPLVSIRWLQTSNTSINGGTVASGGTSRISGIYVKGIVAGGTTQNYVHQNVSVGNVTSYNVVGLNSSTTYYYVVRASNSADTSANSNEISVTTTVNVLPTISTSTPNSFGDICLNSTTIDTLAITGSNLTAGNINLSAVTGFSYALTQGGPYTATLSIPQAGGSFSQTIFIRFNPTMIQNYSDTLTVSGGGAQNYHVMLIGSGVNAAPTVFTHAANAITYNSAKLNGVLNTGGCSAVTAYGFEYSTIFAFAQGSGTPVTAALTTGGSFAATISSLQGATKYYYRAFASNNGGTGYGALDSFITLAAPPSILSATGVSSFGNVCVNSTISYQSFILSGTNLTAGNLTVQALPGYVYSLNQNGPFNSTLSIPQAGGTFSDTVFILFAPTATQAYNGNIVIQGGGANSIQVAVQGTGVDTPPAVVTGNSSGITSTTVTLSGTIINSGCAVPLNSYGIEYSSINNFTPGTGISVPANNNAGGFTVSINSLVPGATYYYRAYATNGNTTGYGALASFTTNAIGSGLVVGPNPVTAGGQITVSKGGLQPGYHAIRLINTSGMTVFNLSLNITGNFINENFNIPASIAPGTYVLSVMNGGGVVESKLIVIL